MRFQDHDDDNKRNRNEISRLQRDIDEIARENEERAREINVIFIYFLRFFNEYSRNGDANTKH